MRNKITAAAIGLALAVCFSGCGSQNAASSNSGAAVSGSSAQAAESVSGAVASSSGAEGDTESATQAAVLSVPLVEDGYKLSDCITLGNYKGLSLTKTVAKVTDDDVDSSIRSQMTPEEVTDANATAQSGDTVNIAYTGKVDGREFDGGSSDSYDLTLGSGTFIDGFEDGVIGMKKGETKDLNLKFPDNYTEDLAGKDVVFTVTVNAIKRDPELTDDWVKTNTNGQYTTVDDYRKSVRENLEKQNEEDAEAALQQDAWGKVEEASTFKALPQSYVDEGAKNYEDQTDSYASQYGVSRDDYLEQMGVSADDFETQKEQYGRYTAASRVLLDALVDAEGISTDSDEYKEELQKTADEYSLSSDDLLSQYGEETVEQYVLTKIAADHIISYANVTEA